jgi:hypothetical protein
MMREIVACGISGLKWLNVGKSGTFSCIILLAWFGGYVDKYKIRLCKDFRRSQRFDKTLIVFCYEHALHPVFKPDIFPSLSAILL